MSSNKDIRFQHDYYGIINELEVALCIDGEDYANRDIDVSIKRIYKRLQKQYSMDLSTNTLDQLYASSIIGDEVSIFLDNIYYTYNKLCGCGQYFRYVGELPINLKRINYMGLTKDSMLSVLKLLQCEGQHSSLYHAMEQIKVKIGSIHMCTEKKLFMCLYVSYKLELFELCAAIAEQLYLGGI